MIGIWHRSVALALLLLFSQQVSLSHAAGHEHHIPTLAACFTCAVADGGALPSSPLIAATLSILFDRSGKLPAVDIVISSTNLVAYPRAPPSRL